MGVNYVSDELRDCSRNNKKKFILKICFLGEADVSKLSFPGVGLTVFFTVSAGLNTLELLVINSFSLIFHNLL